MAEAGTLVQDYNYGPNGNRTALTTSSGTTTGTYDAQDRLSTYGDFTYTYGGNGELASRTDTTNGDVTDYVYDARGSLLNVSLPDTTQLDYVIDGQARRVAKKVNGVTTQAFLYKDGLRIIAELDAAGEIVSRFNYVGGSHSPDTMTTGGETYRFVKDQVGSPRLVVNVADGSVAQRLEYDAFGVITLDTNPGFQPFGFAGGLYDADTGLVRFGARDYDAQTGRWTAKDPIRWEGDQTNLFGYGAFDPVNNADPSGLFFCNSTGGPILVGGGTGKGKGHQGPFTTAMVPSGACVGPNNPIEAQNGELIYDVDVVDTNGDGHVAPPLGPSTTWPLGEQFPLGDSADVGIEVSDLNPFLPGSWPRICAEPGQHF